MKRIILTLCLILLTVFTVVFTASCDENIDDIRGLSYTLKDDGTYAVDVGYAKYLPNIEIPAEYEGKPVTEVISTKEPAKASLLKTVIIPGTVTKVQTDAFEGCAIETAEVPTSALLAIRKKSLKTLVINGGERIDEDVFRGCEKLTSITVSDSVIYVSSRAFDNEAIEEAVIPACALRSISRKKLNTVVITSGQIGRYAFEGYNELKSITIGSGVTGIDASSFDGCPSGASVIISPDNPMYMNIGKVIYSKDDDGATLMRYFSGNTDTDFTVPESVKHIAPYAFRGCTALKSITLPKTVTDIGYDSFYGCVSLESISVDEENTKYSSSDGVLYTFDGRELLKYPSGKKANAFSIPDGVEKIWAYAFSDCSSLVDLTFPDGLVQIGEGAFDKCGSIRSVVLPSSVRRIEEWAFRDCIGIRTIVVPPSVTYIGITAFCNCRIADATLPTAAIPALVLYNNMYNSNLHAVTLKTLVINGGNIIDDRAFYRYGLTSVTIGDSVTHIGDTAFGYCDKLESLTLGNKVSHIGDKAFVGCVSLNGLEIPDSIRSIGAYAFAECEKIGYLSIKGGIESIGECAFYNNTSMKTVEIESGSEALTVGKDSFYGVNLEKADVPISVWWRLPSTNKYTNGVTVTIGKGDKLNYIKSLINSDLKSVKVAEGNPEYIVVDDVLYTKDQKTLLWYMPINERAEFSVPDGVTSINEYAFMDADKLTSLILPDSITELIPYALAECKSVKSIKLPENITYIDEYTFSGCTALKSITLPNSVTKIYYKAFENCSELTSIVIGENVTFIGGYAFDGCEKLIYINYRGAQSKWNAMQRVIYWISHTDYIVNYKYTEG